jgi:hypothetical protein
MVRCWCSLSALALLLSGCIDPKADFDSFGELLEQKKRAEMAANMPMDVGDGGLGECDTSVEAVAGTYYFVMRPSVAADSPIPLLMTLAPSGEELSLSLQPLAVKDGKTPVGEPSQGTLRIDGNAFTVPSFEVFIPGDADAVQEGADLTVQIDMKGALCRDGKPIEFLCGDVNGKVTVPVDLALDGSTFGAHRVVDGAEPVFSASCAEREGSQ